MRHASWASALPVLILSLKCGFAQAGAFSAEAAFDSVSMFAGKGADHNLLELPGKIIRRNLDWDDTYFAALGFGKDRGTVGHSVESLGRTLFAPVRHGYEIVLVKHFGLQSNAEVGAAYMLKTPDLQLAQLGVNFGAGAGLSYAVGNPRYEDGPDDHPERRYRMQFLALFDLDWHLIGSDSFSVITRVHHRSGVYGLVAPRHVGSNFLAIGVRSRF